MWLRQSSSDGPCTGNLRRLRLRPPRRAPAPAPRNPIVTQGAGFPLSVSTLCQRELNNPDSELTALRNRWARQQCAREPRKITMTRNGACRFIWRRFRADDYYGGRERPRPTGSSTF